MSPKRIYILSLIFLFGGFGCTSDESKTSPKTEREPPTQPPSTKSRVRLKSGDRLARDLAQGLALPREDICRELGRYDCVDETHRIVLGGVEPYRLGVREPILMPGITTPIATERVVLSACAARADRDFDDPVQATRFEAVVNAPASANAREETVDRLYRNLLLRPATGGERAALEQLHEALTAATPELTDIAQAREWAVLACFAIGTSLESLFY